MEMTVWRCEPSECSVADRGHNCEIAIESGMGILKGECILFNREDGFANFEKAYEVGD